MIRTLVVYASKYGSTKDVAYSLAMVLGPSKCISCQDYSEIYQEFELVILGGPIYSNLLLPELRGFMKSHKEWLQNRFVAFFNVGICGDEQGETLNQVISDLGKDPIWFGTLRGRLDMAKIEPEDYAAAELILKHIDQPEKRSIDLDHAEIMRAAMSLKRARDMIDSDLDVNSRRQAVEGYLRSRNTCVLATYSDLGIRATPLEYRYRDGAMYILTEGGEKMAHILMQSEVAVVVNDEYQGHSTLFGLQLRGKATILTGRSLEYDQALKDSGYDPVRMRKLPFDMSLIKVEIIEAELLSAALKKSGKTIKQRVKFV